MNTDKEFVLAHWDNGIDENYTDDDQFFFIADIGINFDSWSAAAEFTRNRLEEIRQVLRDIQFIQEYLDQSCDSSWRPIAAQSILVRLQAALAELKRGMK